MNDPIGFIGLGNMGEHMSGHLLEAGHSLVVYDIRDEAVAPLTAKGAAKAASPGEVAQAAETIILSLPRPEIVKDVVLGQNGIIFGDKVKTVVDLSTIGPQMAGEVAAGLAAKGLSFVDSPVSGGVAGARKGSLAVMVSCPDEDFAEVRDLLNPIGTVFHVGTKPGLGQTMKLANNMLSAAALAISSEAMVMGVKAGLDPSVMLDVINAGSGRNTATDGKFATAILPRTFDVGFANGLMHKDVALYLKTASALEVPTELASAVELLWRATCSENGPEADFTTIVKCVERRAGVEVKSRD
ncbi:MAG: NAD(P)-dependent oxidoreductase [Proteobacteria bacterium]|nr:NAD(P)-dependent oxidoreductase [Pseudomonadota bacterium]